MRPIRRTLVVLLALALGAAGCDDDVTGPRVPRDVTFDNSLGVDLAAMTELDSGVYIQTLTEGQGEAAANGDVVNVDYTLWLPNGTLVDAGTGAEFPLQSGAVIEGFRIGLIGMLLGETRLLVIPSALGYGSRGSPGGIPPHSVLVFRVTLNALNP